MRERAKARQAWADYLAMGPERSLEALLKRYSREPKPLTSRLATLKKWSAEFGWQARLAEIADVAARAAEEQELAYRRSIMEAGYALAHERVRALQDLAGILHGELLREDRRWCRDVKQVGSGESSQRVDIERFNAPEVEQFRGLLDDIAKEMGQRRQRIEHSGPEGGPIMTADVIDLSRLTEEELEALERLVEKAAHLGRTEG